MREYGDFYFDYYILNLRGGDTCMFRLSKQEYLVRVLGSMWVSMLITSF